MTLASTNASARILVVDDEPNGREGLCTLLKEEGFVVCEAADGEDGLKKLLEFKPDAVLCDLRLPKLDGISLLQKARELEQGARFIMMTGFGRSEGADAVRRGAEDYLIKPLELTEVMAAVEKALAKTSH